MLLSRVIGGSPSNIFGTLNVSGGKFFLVNTSGIFFAPGSQVNASGLVASTLDIDDQDFLKKKYRFRQTGNQASALIQEGQMNIGSGGLALLGGAVENSGFIEATAGNIIIAGGREMTLSLDPSGLLSVMVDRAVSENVYDQNGKALANGVSNSGKIIADGSKVILTAEAAKDIFSRLISNTGVIEANSTVNRNGVIELVSNTSEGIVANSGVLNARGAQGLSGGTVRVLGEKVGLLGGEINVSGDTGGGNVNIGGNFQGNGDLRNADYTLVNRDAKIHADALTSGDGGNVVVWADKGAQVDGLITARGGSQSGNGGFVETSGKEFLNFDATVDTSASHGNSGSLLLDPSTLTILDAAAGGTQDTAANDGQILSADPTIGANTISWGKIDSLAATTNIILEATGLITINNVTGAAGGSTTAADLVMLDLTSGSLTIRSTTGNVTFADVNDTIRSEGGAINFQASSASGSGVLTLGNLNTSGAVGNKSGGITLNARQGITTGSLTTGGSSVTINADAENNGVGNYTLNTAKSILTSGGNASITARNLILNGLINSGTGTTSIVSSRAGTIGLGASGGNMNINNTELQNITAGILKIGNATSGNISITSAITPSNVGALSLQTNGTITQTAGSTITTTNLALRARNTITLNENNNVASLSASNTVGDIRYKDLNSLAIDTVDALSGVRSAGSFYLQSAGTITQTTGSTITATGLALRAGTGITLNENNDVTTLAASSTTGNVQYKDLNAVTVSTVDALVGMTSAGNMTLNANSGITVNQNITSTAGTVNLNSDFDSNGSGDLNVANLMTIKTTNQALTVKANDINLNTTGKLNSGTAKTTLLVSDGGTIGLGNTAANFTLNNTELQNITAGILKIGDATNGNIAVTSAIAPSNVGALSLQTNGTITQTVGSTIAADGLALRAGTGITLNENNNVTTLAASSTSGNIQYKEIDSVTVGTVDALVGVNGGANTVSLSSGGNMTLSQEISGGNVNLTSLAGALIDGNAADNNITAENISLTAQTGIGSIADPLEIHYTGITGALSVDNAVGDVLVDATSSGTVDPLNIVTDPLGFIEINLNGDKIFPLLPAPPSEEVLPTNDASSAINAAQYQSTPPPTPATPGAIVDLSSFSGATLAQPQARPAIGFVAAQPFIQAPQFQSRNLGTQIG